MTQVTIPDHAVGTNKEILVDLKVDLLEAAGCFPELAKFTSRLHTALDMRIGDRHKPVDSRAICSLTEEANAYLTASDDLRQFENDPISTAEIYRRLEAINAR